MTILSRIKRIVNPTAEMRFLRQYDFTGKTVYDVGAYHGDMTLLFARQASMVFAFEPNPANMAVLQRRVGDRGNIVLFGFGISDHEDRSVA